MSKTKFLVLIIVVLLLTNLATIFMRPPPPHHGPKGIIIKELGFDADQIKKYDNLIQAHGMSIRSLDEKIRKAKNELYRTLASVDSTKKTKLLVEIGELQATIETNHYTHFQDIKAICTQGQLSKFETLTNDLAKLFEPESHPPRP